MRTKELRRIWGQSIKSARLAQGLTQRQLADRLDVRHASINRWEQGVSGITDDHKVVVAEFFGMDVHTLFPLVRTSA